ncbi:hypothetical protein PTQ21_00220 [Paenibacillus marchantiae]|uniref:hypothetical protein n=1 Tax=Paenibacillus TaxID=44249 RepID=UPI0022A94B7D|nr:MULTISPECIES: hypothetical protein [Paenibacillus]MCZ1264540.1 hypothetical protein [Paenibacillus tundrae]WDQ32828.1 hypothetical protein PTQ21_00220 [Paenibacillus marchantiae]
MSKEKSGSTWGSIFIIVLIFLVILAVKGCNSVVQHFSEGSVEEQGQIVLEFEKQVNEIDKGLSKLGNEVAEELKDFSIETIPNLEMIEEAERQYRVAANRIKDIDIPRGLTTERKSELKSIQEDFEYSYTFKSNAMWRLSNFYSKGELEDLEEMNTDTALAQDNFLDGVAGLVTLKKELGVLDIDATTKEKIK